MPFWPEAGKPGTKTMVLQATLAMAVAMCGCQDQAVPAPSAVTGAVTKHGVKLPAGAD